MTLQQPFNKGIINNYTIILSGLPQIQSYLSKDILRNQAVQIARYVVDALLRNTGDYENQINEINSSLRNPIILYKTGWNIIISIPFMTLYWLGIFTKNALNLVTNNFVFKIIVGIVALVGIISSIMTIVLGYAEFLTLIKGLFN